jgi:hypothetical protein
MSHPFSGLFKGGGWNKRAKIMILRIKAKIERGGEFFPAILTNEHPESSYGLPVVVIDGEKRARKPEEVFLIRVTDFELANLARRAGYLALKG